MTMKSNGVCESCGNEAVAAKAHNFFEALAKESRKPHYGDQSRGFIGALLHRATEAGLYQPEAT